MLLDNAVERTEAASLRDRLEVERTERAKGILGGSSRVYGAGEARMKEEAGIAKETEKEESKAEEVERETEEFEKEKREGEETTRLPKPEAELDAVEKAKSKDEPEILFGEIYKSHGASKRHFPFLPVLAVVLVVLAIAGVSWYLYRSGVLTSAKSLPGKFIGKIADVHRKSAMTLFNLKNEQEPALDGSFFVVRGVIQNRQKVLIPYVPLRIKIFDSKNRVILTGQTIAGRVLKPEEISRMTVQNVNESYRSLVEQNKRSTGRLAPGSKLPFAFLFDLSKFPRKTAKTFQIEILKPKSNK